jgi:hypothetical protein
VGGKLGGRIMFVSSIVLVLSPCRTCIHNPVHLTRLCELYVLYNLTKLKGETIWRNETKPVPDPGAESKFGIT